MMFVNGQQVHPNGQPIQGPQPIEFHLNNFRVQIFPTNIGWHGRVIDTTNQVVYEHINLTRNITRNACTKYIEDLNAQT